MSRAPAINDWDVEPVVPPGEAMPDLSRYSPLELHVAGLLSTFPPFDKEHPALRLPMARTVVDAITEWEPDDARLPEGNTPQ